MKYYTNRFFWLTTILLFTTMMAFSQKESSRRMQLNQLGDRLKVVEQNELKEAMAMALLKDWKTEGLVRLNQFGLPQYIIDRNNVAAATTGTISLRNSKSVNGAGMKIGLWEAGGIPLLTHQDFQSRITIIDGTPPGSTSAHATHVAGTLIGSPPSSAPSTSRGMAPNATIDAYRSNGDLVEMTAAGASSINEVGAGKLLVSNHSYGAEGGWQFRTASGVWEWTGGTANYVGGGVDPGFGFYTNNASSIDSLGLLAEYYLIVWAAGNENSHNPTPGLSQVRNGPTGAVSTYNTSIHPLGDGVFAGGFGNVFDPASKNILLVGATNNAGQIGAFSCRGPINDGRIKPDVCGVGVNLTSAINASNTAYGPNTGTSMASPQVAGSLILLQELYSDEHTVGAETLYMKSASLKALAIHSATDLGNAGPDYTYGWGRIDMAAAGDFIEEDAKPSGAKVLIIEDVIPTSSTVYEIEVDAVGGNTSTTQLQATLVYHDVPGNTLINDLDLIIERNSTGSLFVPWLLDPSNPLQSATGGDDDINNVERIQISSVAETYTVRITVEGGLFQNDPQPFSLIISGLDPGCQSTIQHRMLDLPSNTYTAKDLIRSEAKLATAGREITYKTNGRIELKPGFHARAQTSTGAGFFKTSAGTCN